MKKFTLILLLVFSTFGYSQNTFLINTPTGFISRQTEFTISPEPAIVNLNLSYFDRLNVCVGAYLGNNLFSGKGGGDWDVKIDYNAKFRLLNENIIIPALSVGFFKNPYNNIFDSEGRYFFNRNCAYIAASKQISLYNFHNALAYPVDNHGKEEYIWLTGISRKVLLTEFFIDASNIFSKNTEYKKTRFNFGISMDILKYFRLKFTISDFTRTPSKQLWVTFFVPGSGKKESEKWEPRSDGDSRDYKAWPTAGGNIISDFGNRTDPFTGRNAFHSGIDINVEEGTPVYAVLEGRILESSEDGDNGKYVIIEHKKGLLTYYLHLSKIFVKEKLNVSEGEIIGLSGSTGRSKGPHLHFAAKVNNEFVDPELILSNINEFK